MEIKRLDRLPSIVYHGTTTEYRENLKIIRVDFSRKDLDFGQGFYTTSIRKQAIEWARGKCWNNHKPLVLTYRVNLGMIKSLKGQIFDMPNENWVEYIYKHRMEIVKNNEFNYDYVYGHTADGKTSLLVEEIKNGNKTYEDFSREIYPVECNVFYYDQLFFKTKRSLACLTRINEEVL